MSRAPLFFTCLLVWKPLALAARTKPTSLEDEGRGQEVLQPKANEEDGEVEVSDQSLLTSQGSTSDSGPPGKEDMPFGTVGSEWAPGGGGAFAAVMCGTCPLCDHLRFTITDAHVGAKLAPAAHMVAKIKNSSFDGALFVVNTIHKDVYKGGVAIMNNWTYSGVGQAQHTGDPSDVLTIEFASEDNDNGIMTEEEIKSRLTSGAAEGIRVQMLGPMTGLSTGFLSGVANVKSKDKTCRCGKREEDLGVLNDARGGDGSGGKPSSAKPCNTCCSKEAYEKLKTSWKNMLTVLPDDYTNQNCGDMTCPDGIHDSFPTALESYKQCRMSTSGNSGSVWFSPGERSADGKVIKGAKAVCMHRGAGTASGNDWKVQAAAVNSDYVYAVGACTPFHQVTTQLIKEDFPKNVLNLTNLHFCSQNEREKWQQDGGKDLELEEVIFALLKAKAVAAKGLTLFKAGKAFEKKAGYKLPRGYAY